MPPRSRATATTTTTTTIPTSFSTPLKSTIPPRSSRRTRSTHKLQQHDGSLSPDPLDILPFVSPLKLAKREILGKAGSDISSSSTDGTTSYARTRRRKEESDETSVQQPSTPNWSVNVTIAGTDRILPQSQASAGGKRNIEELDGAQTPGASSYQATGDSPVAWVQVIRSPAMLGTPVREKELNRVANAGSTPGVVGSTVKRRAVRKRSPRKNKIEVDSELHDKSVGNQGSSGQTQAGEKETTIETPSEHMREPVEELRAANQSELLSSPSVSRTAIHQESSVAPIHVYEDEPDRSPPLLLSSPVVEHQTFVERTASSLNVPHQSKKTTSAKSLRNRASSPLKPICLPPPPQSPVLLSQLQSSEATSPPCRTLTKEPSPVPSITSSILTTTELPPLSASDTLRERIPNPNPDPGWSRAHWVLLTQLHPRRMDPLPSRALVKPPNRIMHAFPSVSEEELARRMLALDRIRLRREMKMEHEPTEPPRREDAEGYVRKYY
ncbi:hypothetical protein POJ06DRAFT_105958 [Lipomyces tetrasporus]|uniref:Uncharacterized protein n=1 Tax=Lipomyces tetrasporus TaxID=54092 RepID=A0AAD7QSE8_9ASCO|nr:uncharacterized protein POJ06DRAFT_105958 [Lipomyces tetrasporus]KAJ8100515.1 hypothetical protein POJ06DRAFT_105958 [Lipomyces tetrasporus]